MKHKEPGYMRQCLYILDWKIKKVFKKKPPRRELVNEVERQKREIELLKAKSEAFEELLAEERDKTRDLRKRLDAYTTAIKARRYAMVPHCKNCPSLQRREPKVGKIVCTCSNNPGAVISVMEGRTSPK